MCNLDDDPQSSGDDPDLSFNQMLDDRTVDSMSKIDGCNERSDEMLWPEVETHAPLLNSSIWGTKNLPYDADLKYCDLDEFLYDSGNPLENKAVSSTTQISSEPVKQESMNLTSFLILPLEQNFGLTNDEEQNSVYSEPWTPLCHNPPSPADSTRSFTSSSLDFEPRSRTLSDKKHIPQSVVKKARKQVRYSCSQHRKQFVPDGLKDEKYWVRRRKNNIAAKRSRDARRIKENQIALRAAFLEKENIGLTQEMERLKRENITLKQKLSKFSSC